MVSFEKNIEKMKLMSSVSDLMNWRRHERDRERSSSLSNFISPILNTTLMTSSTSLTSLSSSYSTSSIPSSSIFYVSCAEEIPNKAPSQNPSPQKENNNTQQQKSQSGGGDGKWWDRDRASIGSGFLDDDVLPEEDETEDDTDVNLQNSSLHLHHLDDNDSDFSCNLSFRHDADDSG